MMAVPPLQRAKRTCRKLRGAVVIKQHSNRYRFFSTFDSYWPVLKQGITFGNRIGLFSRGLICGWCLFFIRNFWELLLISQGVWALYSPAMYQCIAELWHYRLPEEVLLFLVWVGVEFFLFTFFIVLPPPNFMVTFGGFWAYVRQTSALIVSCCTDLARFIYRGCQLGLTCCLIITLYLASITVFTHLTGVALPCGGLFTPQPSWLLPYSLPFTKTWWWCTLCGVTFVILLVAICCLLVDVILLFTRTDADLTLLQLLTYVIYCVGFYCLAFHGVWAFDVAVSNIPIKAIHLTMAPMLLDALCKALLIQFCTVDLFCCVVLRLHRMFFKKKIKKDTVVVGF